MTRASDPPPTAGAAQADPILGPAAVHLDAIGLKCPLPVLKTRAALRRLSAGDLLVVVADDPLAAIDIPHFAAQNGHAIVESEARGAILRFVLRRAPG